MTDSYLTDKQINNNLMKEMLQIKKSTTKENSINFWMVKR